MEKVENKKGVEKLFYSTKAKYIIGTILLSGIGIALPRIYKNWITRNYNSINMHTIYRQINE